MFLGTLIFFADLAKSETHPKETERGWGFTYVKSEANMLGRVFVLVGIHPKWWSSRWLKPTNKGYPQTRNATFVCWHALKKEVRTVTDMWRKHEPLRLSPKLIHALSPFGEHGRRGLLLRLVKSKIDGFLGILLRIGFGFEEMGPPNPNHSSEALEGE